jgi:alpha-galactosidase
MWAVLAAPLMISDDLTSIRPASRSAVSDGEVIAIDQDPAGVQGTLVSSTGQGQVWVKPLADGSRAVALLNRGSSPARIRTSAVGVGMPAAARYQLRDVWRHVTRTSGGPVGAEVGPQSTVLLRVSLAG